ncbi:TraR/DksA C4-type zinc finger protein [Actinoplanes sp. NPDC049548]|uniref:TraR/DksA family transcriptional regulator n=1 Tax=Actinoplanes sp. NPDC049548 TaxID=3155152 RepID=UPI00341B0F54
MTTATERRDGESWTLLQTMLEEQFTLHTHRLTELTVSARLPRRGGYDDRTLEASAAAARQGIADTAHALRRMSEGTYGRCEECSRPIPLGRLRAQPHARYCTPCHRSR